MNSDRKHFNFNDLEQWLDRHRVTEIECLVPDLTGVARGKILPRQKFTEDRGMRLPEAVVAMGVTGEFPSEGPYYDVISPTDHDMHLRPDPRTVRIVPWASDPTAQMALRLDLERALACLAPQAREVLLLVAMEQFSYAQAAQMLGVPVGTVMSRLSRAREQLRRLMEGGKPGPAVLRAVK